MPLDYSHLDYNTDCLILLCHFLISLTSLFAIQMLFIHEFLSRLILLFRYDAEVLTYRYFGDYLYVSRAFIGSSIDFCFDIILIRMLYTLQPMSTI